MIELTREVRFTLANESSSSHSSNSWSGSLATPHVAPFIVLRCTVAGELDSKSNYVCNIKVLDSLVRNEVVPKLRGLKTEPLPDRLSSVSLLKISREELIRCLPSRLELAQLVFQQSPYVNYSWSARDPQVISYTEQFEFSASHRLHNSQLSDKENRELFGKCNHVNGHGHNYVVDVTVVAHTEPGEVRFNVSKLHEIVKTQVIDRLDHRNLNIDVEVFKSLNPTVENIATTIFSWLHESLQPTELQGVRVYETPKTWAEVTASSLRA